MKPQQTTIYHSKHLPQMKLPKFTGNYSEYKNFIGLFKSIIDSDALLSNIEKHSGKTQKLSKGFRFIKTSLRWFTKYRDFLIFTQFCIGFANSD